MNKYYALPFYSYSKELKNGFFFSEKIVFSFLATLVFNFQVSAQRVEVERNTHIIKAPSFVPVVNSSNEVIVGDTTDRSTERVENTTATSNNSCAGAISLTVGGSCVNANNSGNTKTGLTPSCDGGSATREQWFCFQATASNNFIRATYVSSTATYFTPFIEVYGPFSSCAAGCTPTAASELGCMQCSKTINDLSSITFTAGQYYLIQFVDYGGISGARNSTFCISVLNPVTCGACTTTCGSIATYNSVTVPASWSVENPKFGLKPVATAGVTSPTYCYTCKANNSTITIDMGSYMEGGTGFFSFNWALYTNTCTLVSSGNISNLTTSGVACDTSYVLCISFDPAGQVDSISPYLYATTSTCTVLPIDLISFKANYNSDFNNVSLQWSTASEQNNKFFTIEKSVDGTTWNTVATVQGFGTTSVSHTYDAMDENPYAGVTYYRLKQTDFDGYYTFPSTVVLNIPSKSSANLFPNPTAGNVTLRYASQSPDPIKVKIIDLSGKILSSYSIDRVMAGVNNFEVGTGVLSPGMYFMQVSNPQKTFYLKFVKE